MPPTATYEDIKTYQQQVEKNKITPHGLAPCSRCNLESLFFKLKFSLIFAHSLRQVNHYF